MRVQWSSFVILLSGCGWSASGEADGTASRDLEAGAEPSAAPVDWRAEVSERLAVDARRIVPAEGGFAAALPAVGTPVRFGADGAVLGSRAEAVRVRFAGWGANDALQALPEVPPRLGDCADGTLPDGACARRLEYAYPNVTAWWVGLDDGVEFGWDVDAPPPGGSEMAFLVEIEGADWVAASGEGAEFVDGEGRTWLISEALSWDADGRPLPTTLTVDGDRLEVRVDAAGAVYPVTVDPLLTAASWNASGEAAESRFGASVAGVGDVNGDGYDDIMVGAPALDDGANVDAGRAYLYYGSAAGPSTSAGWTATGEGAYQSFGGVVAGAGDVNGDGYDDVVVSAYRYSSGTSYYLGRAYVYHGSSGGLATTPAWTATGSVAYDYLGSSVAGAGDVNGDGYGDVAVGAPYAGSVDVGRAYVYHGSAAGLSSAAAWTATGVTAHGGLGTGVAGAGDVNGDGYDDLIVGAGYDGIGPPCCTGRAEVYYGSSSGLASTAAWSAVGEGTSNYFGYAVSGAGDVNGDGYADILVGAHYYNSIGRAYVYYGSAAGPATSASWTYTGTAVGDGIGWAISNAGDVDNDGYDDIILGAYGHDPASGTDAGGAFVFYGSSTGLGSSPWTAEGSAGGDLFGGAVSDAGDVNGDGYDDVLVGADQWYYASSPYPGQAYVFLGSGDADGDGYSSPTDCDDTDAAVNPGATEVWYDGVDQNCDGLDDYDRDGDGYTAIRHGGGDCDDGRASVHPGAREIWYDGTDQNCDGRDDYDRDGDGYASSAYGGTDCDDGRARVNPGGTEITGNRIDENCNGSLLR